MRGAIPLSTTTLGDTEKDPKKIPLFVLVARNMAAARGASIPRDAAMEYMRRHNLSQMFEELSTELVVQQPGNPREFVYDLLGNMLNLPPRNGGTSIQDKAPQGFEKVKMVVESVGFDGACSHGVVFVPVLSRSRAVLIERAASRASWPPPICSWALTLSPPGT
jgi:hypothetical protein